MIKVMIRGAAKRRGIKNAYQFGQSIGVKRMVASRIWNNEQPPKLKTLDRICAAWGCKLEELVVYKADGSRNGHTASPPPPKQRVDRKITSDPRTKAGKLSRSKRSR